MERVTFEIEREDVYDALKAEAAAHGRSVSQELASLVEQTYGEFEASPDRNWVSDLIRLAEDAALEDGILELVPARAAEPHTPLAL